MKEPKKIRTREEAPVAGSGHAFPYNYQKLVETPTMNGISDGLKKRKNVTIFEGGIGFEPEPINLGIVHVMNSMGLENIKKAYWFEPNGMEYDYNKMALEKGSLKHISDKVELSEGNVFTDMPPEKCDLVFSHMVMPHFTPEEREEFFHRLVDMVKDGGHLFVDVLPSFDNSHVKHEIFNRKGELDVEDVENSIAHLNKMGLELLDTSKGFFILKKKK